MSPTLTTFLFEAANFLILAALLGWLFFNPVRQALQKQTEEIDAASRQAEQKLAEVEQLRRQSAEERQALAREVETLRTKELEAARHKAEQIIAEAREAARREREMQLQQATREVENQAARLSRASAAAAADVVARLLGQIDGPELESALTKAACERLRAIPPRQLLPIRVESAQPLSDANRSQVIEAVDGAVNEQQITWQVLSELGPGVRITTGQGLIDATAVGLAQFARRTLLAEMNHREPNGAPLE